MLTECRKLGLSFFSATQVIDQIPTEVKAAIYGATSIKAAGNVSFSDASMLAREMRTSPAFIQGMKTFEWAFHVGDSDRAVKVLVPPGALESMPILNVYQVRTSYTSRDRMYTETEKAPPAQATPSTPIQEQVPSASKENRDTTTVPRGFAEEDDDHTKPVPE